MMDTVEVIVVEASRTGVKVRILDDEYTNRLGFIRRQELSWDQRANHKPSLPDIGKLLTAKVLGSSEARYMRLSLRLGDPWKIERIEERFQKNQLVQGQVVQLSRFGAFVQLVPGVNALARHQAIPMLPNAQLDTILSVGDEVQAVITEINSERKEIEISLTEWLRQLSLFTPKERNLFQIELFGSIVSTQKQNTTAATDKTRHNLAEAEETSLPDMRLVRQQYPVMTKLESVLIIEDSEADRGEMGRRIQETLKIRVDCAESGKEALGKVKEEIGYDLILIDVNLPAENALEIVDQLRTIQPHSVIVFMSHDPAADEKLPGNCVFVLKDQGFVSILQCVEQMRGSNGQSRQAGEKTDIHRGDFIRHLGMEAFAQRSLEETLQLMLHRLRLQARTSQAIVFKVDSNEKEVSVVAADPILEENTQRHLLDRLYYSPVQNVVEDEEPYYEINTLIRRRHPRFERLYEVLPFQSCFGLPLTIPDLETRHALFLFDENRPRFELEDLDNARLAVRFLQVALERSAFFDFMKRYEVRYSRGLLIGSLMHELANKLPTLGTLVESLPKVLKEASNPTNPTERSSGLQEAQEIVEELRESTQELSDLADAYLQIAKENWEAVDVNAVVEKVRLQLNKLAEETEVAIYIKAGDLPPARAISSRLEQILLNLVLNAIQQIGRQRETMAELSKQRPDESVLLQKGQVIIQTRRLETNPACPIQILVIDTGPGIRYPDQKHLFVLDATTRDKGHGWGLFICRNLTEILRGRLRLVGSLRFVGSAFALELPSFASRGGAQ